jgi:hypothetical protein
MAIVHGRESRLYVNGYDLSDYATSVTAGADVDAAETSVLTAAAKTFIPGTAGGTLSAEGRAAFGITPAEVDEILRTILGTSSTLWDAIYGSSSASPAPLGLGFPAFETGYEVSSPIGDVCGWSVDAQSQAGPLDVVALAVKAYRAASGNSTAIQDPSAVVTAGVPGASTGGAESHLHVFSADPGVTLTVMLEHATTLGGAYTAFATHTAVLTAGVPAYERVVVAGTLQPYVRSRWTLAGGGATFAHLHNRK